MKLTEKEKAILQFLREPAKQKKKVKVEETYQEGRLRMRTLLLQGKQ